MPGYFILCGSPEGNTKLILLQFQGFKIKTFVVHKGDQ